MNTANNAWAMFYQGIERANIAIRGLRNFGDVENNPQLAQLLGEVLTLRAVVYNDLIKGWGDVPARFEPVNSETVYLPRSDRDVIYKQLLADLEEAATLVAWPNETSMTRSTERVNKAFVKGLRARLRWLPEDMDSEPTGCAEAPILTLHLIRCTPLPNKSAWILSTVEQPGWKLSKEYSSRFMPNSMLQDVKFYGKFLSAKAADV
jgi:hypothetical protein